jgi:hypothetical protein
MDWNEIFVTPLQNFFSAILSYLPKILAVAVLLLLAWILARVFRNLTFRLMRATGIDRRMGRAEQTPIARGSGTAVFWIIWILFLLAAFQVLGLQGVIDSLQLLFAKVFNAIPNILAAIIVVVGLFFIGRWLAGWINRLLTRVRFNELPVRMGLTQQTPQGATAPSAVTGYIVWGLIMLLGITMAADLLNFAAFNQLIVGFTIFVAQILWGLIVLGLGILVANLVYRILRTGGRQSTIAPWVRGFIIVLSVAIALRAMGFANDMILMIFGIMLGATAIAAAIAFGWGGRQTAGRLLERWFGTAGTSTSPGTNPTGNTASSSGSSSSASPNSSTNNTTDGATGNNNPDG